MTHVAILSAHSTGGKEELDRSLEEMIYEATSSALAEADMTAADLDAVVISGSDQYDGRVISCMVTVGAAGGVGKDVTTMASAGEHALLYAYLRLLAGSDRRVLAVAWSKPSEGLSPEHAELVMAEPFLLRPVGMNSTVAAGLQASAYASKHGVPEHSSASPPAVWPLHHADLPRPTDVAAAAVLATGEVVGQRPGAWILGAGWATDSYELGDRDLSRFAALENAASRAYSGAGIADPATQVDVIEVQSISRMATTAAAAALGVPERSGSRSPAINPSSGRLPDSPPHAAGFLRIIEAARHVMGPAEDAAHPTPKVTVGASLHGFAGQGAAVMVFGACPEGGRR